MAVIQLDQYLSKKCPAMHGINNLIQTAIALRLLGTRVMTKKQYDWLAHATRRVLWLCKNSLIPVQGMTDKQLAETLI